MHTSLTFTGIPVAVPIENLSKGDWFLSSGELLIATDVYPPKPNDDYNEGETYRQALRISDGCLVSYDRGTLVYVIDVCITQEGYVNV